MKKKTKKMPKSIYDFNCPVTIHLPYNQQSEARKILNKIYVGTEIIGKINEKGEVVGTHDDHPNFNALRETHYAVNGHYQVDLKVGVDKNGRLFIKGWKK